MVAGTVAVVVLLMFFAVEPLVPVVVVRPVLVVRLAPVVEHFVLVVVFLAVGTALVVEGVDASVLRLTSPFV